MAAPLGGNLRDSTAEHRGAVNDGDDAPVGPGSTPTYIHYGQVASGNASHSVGVTPHFHASRRAGDESDVIKRAGTIGECRFHLAHIQRVGAACAKGLDFIAVEDAGA